jgi:PAS domain S-box-containing protein
MWDLLARSMKSWEQDLLNGIPRGSVSMTDIILVNAAERQAFISLLPSYTKSAAVATEIMLELERYYTKSHELASRTMQQIQDQDARKLHESEERYKDIFDNAGDMIHIAQPGGEIMYVNNAWMNALGYSLDELRGKPIYALVTEKERERFTAYRERIIAGLPPIESLTVAFKARNGDEIITEGYISCKMKDGKPLYTRGILRDITQRKLAEQKIQYYTEQLMEREENLRQMIRNAPDAIIVIDSNSIIKLWNPKAEAMFGWLAMDVVGKELTETIIPPSFREAHKEGMRRYLQTGEERVMNRSIEVLALNQSKVELYVSLTISSVRQAGEMVFIAFLRDISAQKRNERELQKKKAELERSNKELEQFAWLASHDLKEPLRKIQTFCDLLLNKPGAVASPYASYLTKIQHSAIRMNSLIEDLLSYSNATGDRERFVRTDLNAILQDVIIDLEVAIKAKGGSLNSDKLPVAEVLPFQIRQLFQNLVSNALKFSKQNVPPVIRINCIPLDHDMVRIEVKDNGIGFRKEYSQKVFQIFQRLVPREQYEGTGIGLAMCKKIVENHLGTINAESDEGIGTTFIINLPLKHHVDQPVGTS